jgi:hypothetical protein
MIQTPRNQVEQGDRAHPRVEKLDHLLKAEACLLPSNGQFPNSVDS